MTHEQKELAQIARALSHPVRIYILQLLAGQSCCYSGDLAEELPIARSTLSQHLKALKDAGLIQGEINPPKIKYCINKENWEKAKVLFSGLFDDAKSFLNNNTGCSTNTNININDNEDN
jgi:ArsR family transcriptional regulator, arsenate/arsenite/antimonite-responsive transcriptional repressor